MSRITILIKQGEFSEGKAHRITEHRSQTLLCTKVKLIVTKPEEDDEIEGHMSL